MLDDRDNLELFAFSSVRTFINAHAFIEQKFVEWQIGDPFLPVALFGTPILRLATGSSTGEVSSKPSTYLPP
jgi:hypothetical protein